MSERTFDEVVEKLKGGPFERGKWATEYMARAMGFRDRQYSADDVARLPLSGQEVSALATFPLHICRAHGLKSPLAENDSDRVRVFLDLQLHPTQRALSDDELVVVRYLLQDPDFGPNDNAGACRALLRKVGSMGAWEG